MALEWRVLLVGGSAGTGKTTIAQGLARRLATPLLLADDVRLALQEVTAPAEHPGLHVFLSYTADQWRKPESIRDDWIVVGQALASALRVIMAHHIAVPGVGPIIIEGDGILPSFSAQQNLGDGKQFIGLRAGQSVRAVFLVEQEEAQILHNLRARGRGFETWGQREQEAFGHASWLFGHWLAREAAAHRLPVLPARPYESCGERILAAVSR